MNQLWLHMLSKVLCVVFVWIAILVPGDLSANILPPPEDTVRLVDDPEALPYRFKEQMVRTHTGEGRQSGFRWAFMEPERNESDGVFHIQQLWSPERGLTGVVFCRSIGSMGTLNHENIKTEKLNDWVSYDSDGDGEPELAAIYLRDDSLWLWRHDPGGDTRDSSLVVVGNDRDGDGFWDGTGYVRVGEDFNEDGIPELCVFVDCGYDIEPRALHLVDGATLETMWKYDITSGVSWVDVFPADSGRRIGVSLASRGNAAVANDMDDDHSWLFMLDSLGQRLWLRQTGGIYNSGQAVTFDIGQDGQSEIITAVRYETAIPGGDTVGTGYLLALDTDGRTLDSIGFEEGTQPWDLQLVDLDQDGIAELAVSTSKGEVYFFDKSLDVMQSLAIPDGPCSIVASGDFLGEGQTQVLLAHGKEAWVLLSSDLSLLAQTGGIYTFDNAPTYRSVRRPDRLSLAVQSTDGHRAISLGIVPNPWYTVFFRKPWLAAAAGGAPLLVIAGVIALFLVSVRRKNRVIAQTNSQLQTAMRQLREAQARLVVAEKYKQARDIAGGFAHEIRNALVPIEGVLQRVQHHSKGSEKAEKITNYCRMGERSLDDALSLTEQIGKYAKLEATKEEQPVELMGLIGEVVETNRVAAENAGVTVRVEGPGEALVRSNRQQLQVVLTNLLRNSLDALTNQGDGSILFAVRRENQSTFLTVTDNGPGIPAADADRVFEMFYSTKPDTGTGIGLAMVRKIVELYDGEIRLDAARGPGATFVIRLKED